MLCKGEGKQQVAELLAQLIAVTEGATSILHQSMQQHQSRDMARRLREEQDREFEMAIRADREREEREMRELEAQQAREARLQQLGENIPHEPSPEDKDATLLVIRLLDGSRMQRRFDSSERVQVNHDDNPILTTNHRLSTISSSGRHKHRTLSWL
jgi:FAS-associated factor 2